jgi:hypothetical protein
MHTGNYTSMHTRDNLVVNQCHSVNANYRLHPCDRHDAVDMPHIVRPRNVLISDLVYIVIFRSCDVTVTRTSNVAVSVDIADFRHGSVPIDRVHACAGDWLLAVYSIRASRLRRYWERDNHRSHQSSDTSQPYCWTWHCRALPFWGSITTGVRSLLPKGSRSNGLSESSRLIRRLMAER